MGVFALIVLGIIVLVVLIGLSSAIRIINEYERGVLFRLGRLMDLKGPTPTMPSPKSPTLSTRLHK